MSVNINVNEIVWWNFLTLPLKRYTEINLNGIGGLGACEVIIITKLTVDYCLFNNFNFISHGPCTHPTCLNHGISFNV